MHYGSGSVLSSRTGFTASPGGPARPARPGQLSQSILDGLAGGADPEAIRELSHTSAAALLDHVHHTEDPAVVERVLTLVDREGVDIIAELWSQCEPDSLPGVLWRLYLLRTWMRRQRDAIAQLWRIGEPVATTASAIAGIDQAPTADDIARTADSILAGAFTGDFAVALERAAAFTDVVANGLRLEARHLVNPDHLMNPDGAATSSDTMRRGTAQHNAAQHNTAQGDMLPNAAAQHGATQYNATRHHTASDDLSEGDTVQQANRNRAAKLMHTAGNLMATSKNFRHGAALWRRGKLE